MMRRNRVTDRLQAALYLVDLMSDVQNHYLWIGSPKR